MDKSNKNDIFVNLYLFSDKQISDMDKIDKSIIFLRYINEQFDMKINVATTSFLITEQDYIEVNKELSDANTFDNIIFVLENFNYLSFIQDEQKDINNEKIIFIENIKSLFINSEYKIFNTSSSINTIFYFSNL